MEDRTGKQSYARGLTVPPPLLPPRLNTMQVWGGLGEGPPLAPLDDSPHDHVQPQTKDPLTHGATLTPVSSLYPKSLFF